MTAIWIVLAMVFVLAVLGVLAFGFFELSPFAHHADRFRDPSGRRLGPSPHLETRDEFEHRTAS
jgi:hypothetical protein